MKCSEIFKSALRLLNEKGAEDENEDFAERAPFILAAMFSEAAKTDQNYRKANGLGEQGSFSPTYVELSEDFPLSSRFASAATFYLASLLILDENEELSDTFYEKYCDSMSAIASEIPKPVATIEKIKNVY